MEEKFRICYSKWIFEHLVERGYFPVKTLPSPKIPGYSIWVFKRSREFDETFEYLIEEKERTSPKKEE